MASNKFNVKYANEIITKEGIKAEINMKLKKLKNPMTINQIK